MKKEIITLMIVSFLFGCKNKEQFQFELNKKEYFEIVDSILVNFQEYEFKDGLQSVDVYGVQDCKLSKQQMEFIADKKISYIVLENDSSICFSQIFGNDFKGERRSLIYQHNPQRSVITNYMSFSIEKTSERNWFIVKEPISILY